MGSEWEEVRLGDLVDRGALLISDGYRVRNEELGPDGIPFVRGGDIGDGWINTSTKDHIRPELAGRVKVKLARGGDVAFITKGTVGRAGWLREHQPTVVFAPQVAWWRVADDTVLDPRFLFYLIRSREFQAALDGVKTHGAMVADYVSISQQHDFTVRIPPVGHQRAIAHILGTLDDKIELNRHMNETLEAIVRALFKSWFVDFDPVRAKAEGRDPGLPKHIADLFPDSFEDSELGEIPKGWEVHRLGDLFSLEKGLSYKGKYLDESGQPMVNLGCFQGQGRFNESAIKGYSGEYRPRHTVRPGDLVIANTDITQKREVIGSPGLVPATLPDADTLFTHHVFAARFREGAEGWVEFAFQILLREEFRERARGFATGTTVLALPREAVLDFEFAAPPIGLRDAFTLTAAQLRTRASMAYQQSKTLARTRDRMLPRLISGELRLERQMTGEMPS